VSRALIARSASQLHALGVPPKRRIDPGPHSRRSYSVRSRDRASSPRSPKRTLERCLAETEELVPDDVVTQVRYATYLSLR